MNKLKQSGSGIESCKFCADVAEHSIKRAQGYATGISSRQRRAGIENNKTRRPLLVTVETSCARKNKSDHSCRTFALLPCVPRAVPLDMASCANSCMAEL
eukprot:1348322-Pleurochrysis_carterae.AAC.3